MVARNPFRRILSDRGIGGRQVRGGGGKKNQSDRISSDGEGVGSGCWETFFAFTRTAKPVIIGPISITKKRRKICAYLCTHPLIVVGVGTGQQLLLLSPLAAAAVVVVVVVVGVSISVGVGSCRCRPDSR